MKLQCSIPHSQDVVTFLLELMEYDDRDTCAARSLSPCVCVGRVSCSRTRSPERVAARWLRHVRVAMSPWWKPNGNATETGNSRAEVALHCVTGEARVEKHAERAHPMEACTTQSGLANASVAWTRHTDTRGCQPLVLQMGRQATACATEAVAFRRRKHTCARQEPAAETRTHVVVDRLRHMPDVLIPTGRTRYR
jgi:hypothetical protein